MMYPFKEMKDALYEIKGVEFVHISTNNLLSYDKKKSLNGCTFKVYIKGGKKKEIANTISMWKPLGWITDGNTNVAIKNVSGYKWEIKFERLYD